MLDSSFQIEIAIEKLKRYKSPGIDQILTELIQAGGNTLHSETHKLINSIWNKEELPQQWKESIIVPIYKKGHRNKCSNYREISLLPSTYKVLYNVLSVLIPDAHKIKETIRVDFSYRSDILHMSDTGDNKDRTSVKCRLQESL
jgi:hypothetical protein